MSPRGTVHSLTGSSSDSVFSRSGKMTLEQARVAVDAVEDCLSNHVYAVAHTFERNGRRLNLAVTERLPNACRKGRIWKSKPFLTAFKNGERGFDPIRAHSPGGSDGIFVLTRNHRPANAMMTKIFTRFLDKPGSEAMDIIKGLGTTPDDVVPVRLVSHHMRLLGLLHKGDNEDTLVLVDYDDSK